MSTRANYESWVEAGRPDARSRANEVWKQCLADYEPPLRDDAVMDELESLVDRRIAEGGADVD